MKMHPSTADPIGDVFPPRHEWDLAAYDADEAMEGFFDQEPGDPPPGDNRSPSYRWGWANRARDRQIEDDGFDHIRHAYIALRRSAH